MKPFALIMLLLALAGSGSRDAAGARQATGTARQLLNSAADRLTGALARPAPVAPDQAAPLSDWGRAMPLATAAIEQLWGTQFAPSTGSGQPTLTAQHPDGAVRVEVVASSAARVTWAGVDGDHTRARAFGEAVGAFLGLLPAPASHQGQRLLDQCLMREVAPAAQAGRDTACLYELANGSALLVRLSGKTLLVELDFRGLRLQPRA